MYFYIKGKIGHIVGGCYGTLCALCRPDVLSLSASRLLYGARRLAESAPPGTSCTLRVPCWRYCLCPHTSATPPSPAAAYSGFC